MELSDSAPASAIAWRQLSMTHATTFTSLNQAMAATGVTLP